MPSGLSPRNRPGRRPVLPRPHALQLRVELGQRLGQAGVAERLLGQLGQLGALLGAHRVEHPLRGRGPLGQQVDQLVGVLRVLGEELAVLAHELGELLRGVRPAAWFASREFRSSSISRIRSTSLGVTFCIACFIPAKRWSSISRPEQVPDLLVGLAGLGGAPVVGVELAHRAAGVRRQRVELHLAEAGVVGVLVAPSAVRSASSARASSSRTSCRVPSSRLSRCSRLRRCHTWRVRSSRPRLPSMPRRSSSRSAARGEEPSMTSRPTASRAARRSTGGARGSGPSV